MGVGFEVLVGLLSVALFVYCDYTITCWVELIPSEGYLTWRLLALAVAGPLSGLCFGLVGAKMGLAAVSAFVNTGIVMGGVLLGVLVRGEQLTGYQKIGLLFGLASLLLITLGQADTDHAKP